MASDRVREGRWLDSTHSVEAHIKSMLPLTLSHSLHNAPSFFSLFSSGSIKSVFHEVEATNITPQLRDTQDLAPAPVRVVIIKARAPQVANPKLDMPLN